MRHAEAGQSVRLERLRMKSSVRHCAAKGHIFLVPGLASLGRPCTRYAPAGEEIVSILIGIGSLIQRRRKSRHSTPHPLGSAALVALLRCGSCNTEGARGTSAPNRTSAKA